MAEHLRVKTNPGAVPMTYHRSNCHDCGKWGTVHDVAIANVSTPPHFVCLGGCQETKPGAVPMSEMLLVPYGEHLAITIEMKKEIDRLSEERDEAREAARRCFANISKDHLAGDMRKYYPWLED